MYENVSNEDISSAIDQLISYLGVKEETPFSDLVALLREKDVQGCVQEIAARLGLPIEVSLSYVAKDFRPGNTNTFRSCAPARTDSSGHGIEAITAQVVMPEHLPMFGTSDLERYPIRVHVSENCHDHPETFVAVMAHELAHVLLGSLHHPQKDSELHTDLVPVLLGFRRVVQRGRKSVHSMVSDAVTTTCTATYGYLSDSQFRFACDKVRDVLAGHQRDRNRLQTLAGQMSAQLHRATRDLARFGDYLRHLDKHPTRRMKRGDAARMVQFHASDYTREWQTSIAQARAGLSLAEPFAQPLIHYTNGAVRQLRECIRSLELASEQLAQVTGAITGDLRILRRYVGLTHRLRSVLWPGMLADEASGSGHP